ncbi:MAG: RNA polymerase sigma factor, partial [Planctomycetota bacterium JB042]
MIPEAILRETESLRALARGLLGEDADDAVQDGFVAWLERAPSGLERPGGWLTSVVRNLSLHRLRTDRRRRARERTAVPPHVPAAPDELAARRETIEALVAALFSLPEPSREALLLRYLEDLPPREIARRLGVPVETVRTRIKRGLAALRARLDAEHDGDRRAWAGTLAGAFGVPPAPAVSTTLLGALAMGTTVRVLLSGAALVLLAVPVARHLSK